MSGREGEPIRLSHQIEATPGSRRPAATHGALDQLNPHVRQDHGGQRKLGCAWSRQHARSGRPAAASEGTMPPRCVITVQAVRATREAAGVRAQRSISARSSGTQPQKKLFGHVPEGSFGIATGRQRLRYDRVTISRPPSGEPRRDRDQTVTRNSQLGVRLSPGGTANARSVLYRHLPAPAEWGLRRHIPVGGRADTPRVGVCGRRATISRCRRRLVRAARQWKQAG